MKTLTQKRLFIAKHWDFLVVDLLAFILGYYVSFLFRRSLNIRFINQNFLMTYGIVATCSFLFVEILTENLNRIMTRGLIKEIQTVIGQITLTWTVYLSVLFMMHTIHALSRILTVVTYLVCIIFLLVFRNIWKMICRFSKLSDSVIPGLLIITEASRAQTVLNRLMPGELSKQYEIQAVVMNEKGEADYNDWYPHETGLDKVDNYIGQRRLQYAYVELDNREEEEAVIGKLLGAGIIVHRSLGDSVLRYADQSIGELDRKSVIVISGTGSSLVSRADIAWQKLMKKIQLLKSKDR